MEPEERGSQTVVEFVLAILEERFPWLGSKQDEPVSGADAVDELTALYRSLTEQRGQPGSQRHLHGVVSESDQMPQSRLPIDGGVMRNVRMIRTEPDLVWIPREKAVYCENCETVSSSSGRRCGLCGSEQIVPLAAPTPEPWDPSPAPVVALAA